MSQATGHAPAHVNTRKHGGWLGAGLAGKRHKLKQEARFSHWPGEVGAVRQERAGPEHSLWLTWFQDVLAAGRVHLEAETSEEQVHRGHCWTNLVHRCVGELTAARHGCALGSTLNPEEAGKQPGLQRGCYACDLGWSH